MARILILGAAGEMASGAIRELLSNSDHSLLLADRFPPTTPASERHRKRVTSIGGEILERGKLFELLAKCDLVINALYMKHVVEVARAAIDTGVHLVDLGAYADDTANQLKLDATAKQSGSRLVVGCGVAPGLTNILARHAIDRLDETTSVGIYSYITHPLATSPGIVYTRFDASIGSCPVCIDGKLVRRPAFGDCEVINFPPPHGDQEVHLVPHPEPLTLWRNFKIPNLVFKVGYPPGETRRLQSLIELGLASDRPFTVGNTPIIPRDFIAAFIPSTARRRRERTVNVKRVIVRGTKGGRRKTVTYDFAVESVSRSASSRITGTFAALAASQVLEQGSPGVQAPETGLNAAQLLRSLQARGFEIGRSVETSRQGSQACCEV